MIKIVTVCGFGIGTSLILKMSTEKALKQMNIEGDVECTDRTSAKSLAADVYLTSKVIAEELISEVNKPVIVINSFLNVDEIISKLQEVL